MELKPCSKRWEKRQTYDIMMPKMDGYQLCQECKQNDKLKNIPFVFYTATYTSDEDEKFALSLHSVPMSWQFPGKVISEVISA